MAASLELAVTAIRSGRKEEGRQLLNLLIQQNPNNEMAWLWMSSVVNTDEQRARCLYHVLAINPDNELAQRGLKILGIVVTDSRPVKIPRDSQPIKIPKPTPTSQPTFPSVAQVEQSAPAEERRPFRLDPQAIVAELPFTPGRQPLTATNPPAQPGQPANPSQPVQAVQQNVAASAVAESPIDTKPLPDPSKPVPAVQSQQPAEHLQPPSEPVPVVQTGLQNATSQPQLAAERPQTPSEPVPVVQSQAPSEPVPAVQSNPGAQTSPPLNTGALQNPSEPVPVAQPNPGVMPPPQGQTGQLRPPSEPVPVAQQGYYPQYPMAGPMSRQETRPTQPLPTPYSDVTPAFPQQTHVLEPGYQLPPAAVGHSNVTMGMPTQNFPAQNPSQPVAAIHSNPTMGLAPGQAHGQGQQYPSEPVPSIHSNGTVAMPLYPQPQFQPVMAQGAAIHSSATMAMPMGYDPLAALSAPLNRDYRAANAARTGPKRRRQAEEEEEGGDEVNILAVIIFGSLSVTALGGLGMLILLMFTAG